MLPHSEEIVQRVRRLVARHLPPNFDRDWISDSILYESWCKGVPFISNKFIRERCIDSRRKRVRETLLTTSMVYEYKQREHIDEDNASAIDAQDLVVRGLRGLREIERRLIWYRFWMDLTLEDIATRMNLPREDVQSALKVALFKMNQELS